MQEVEERDEEVTLDSPNILKRSSLFKQYTPFTVFKF